MTWQYQVFRIGILKKVCFETTIFQNTINDVKYFSKLHSHMPDVIIEMMYDNKQ